ncbi:hypothetical protein AVEN_35720-1 [Araneus ventricosus]|uniref:C2H2-type domain-containing protein n=1 Tax=Araneus ventricosus TaxID=182803 RepID=A0A4Y2C4B9_ARAVE|nr:hypothetical protein AVEN_35720-1 [Araneus ventricosus]
MNTFSPGIQNIWCQTQTSHVQNIEAETLSNFNYLADPFGASPSTPQHLINFYHQPSDTERENESSLERMLKKQITVESSQIQHKNSQIDLAGSCLLAPKICISHYVTENFINKNKLKDTNEKGGNSADLFSKRGNSSAENFFPEDLERGREISKQNARTFQQQTRIEVGENYRRKRGPTSKKRFECWKCRKGFANESELNIHMQNHDEPKQNKSGQCPKKFSHNYRRKRAPKSKKGFKCWNCRKWFTNESELKILMQNPCEPKHGKPSQYKCGECSEEFSHEWKLEEHLVVHWEVKPFECEHCDLAFKWKNHLTSQMNKYHKSETEAYFSK